MKFTSKVSSKVNATVSKCRNAVRKQVQDLLGITQLHNRIEELEADLCAARAQSENLCDAVDLLNDEICDKVRDAIDDMDFDELASGADLTDYIDWDSVKDYHLTIPTLDDLMEDMSFDQSVAEAVREIFSKCARDLSAL